MKTQNDFLFLIAVTLVIHAAYGMVRLRRQKLLVRRERVRAEKTLSELAHSLYAPLGSIRNFLELIASERLQSEKKKFADYIGIIDESAVRALETVWYYLDRTRLSNNTFAIFVGSHSLRDLLNERLRFYGSVALHVGVAFELHVADNFPAIARLDPRAMSHALDRVLSFILGRSRGKQRVVIRLFSDPEDVTRVIWESGVLCGTDVPAPADSAWHIGIVISVPYALISAEELSSLRTFPEPVFEEGLPERPRDFRIGLKVAERLLERHNGFLDIRLCGDGTTFLFLLPLGMQNNG